MRSIREIVKFQTEDLPKINLKLIEKDLTAAEKSLENGDNFKQIMEQLSLCCNDKSLVHPQWSLLAGRIQMEIIHSEVPSLFSESTIKMKSILDTQYYKFVTENIGKLDEIIRRTNDFNFDIFGVSTLRKSYLAHLKVDDKSFLMETPQYMYLRVATFLHFPDMRSIEETYSALSNGDYTHATPTLFNAGMKRPQLSSCFLAVVDDDMASITKAWHDQAFISMNSGGIGYDYSQIRHSEIGQHGFSRGIVPWLKITNEVLKTVDQAGKRKGSGTIYLRDWHTDIYEFVELRDEGPEDMRAKDLFLGIMVSDLFMKRVEANSTWSLFCPNKVKGLTDKWGSEFEMAYVAAEQEGLFASQVRARDLWQHIINMQIKKGMPFILYMDACNRKSNQKHSGIIRSSNLCVSGDTLVLTDTGNIKISSIEGQKVKVWNGEEWSKVVIRKTGSHQNLLRVNFTNGEKLDCTPEHKFYIQKSYNSKNPIETPTKNLKTGDKLIKWESPVIEINENERKKFKYPYTHGFYCGDGTDVIQGNTRHPKVCLYGEKKNLLKFLDYVSHGEDLGDKMNVTLPKDIPEKYKIPEKVSIKTRLRWLEGYCDADSCVSRNGENESIQIASINKEFLLQVRLLILTLGIDTKITMAHGVTKHSMNDGKGGKKLYNCQALWRLLITSGGVQKLLKLGFSPKRLKLKKREIQRDAGHFVQIESIEFGPEDVDTFCFTEPKKHMGVFNGILTGQCTEILETTNKDEIASCVLASICLNRCVEFNSLIGRRYFNFDKLENLTRALVRNLNQVVDRNYYSSEIPEIKFSNMKHRPLGIGVQGLADVFALLDISWIVPNLMSNRPEPEDKFITSPKARKLNDQIFETIYFAAVKESVELAKVQGAYPAFEGSPASQGMFQFDLWEEERLEKSCSRNVPVEMGVKRKRLSVSSRKKSRYSDEQWETLRNDMMTYGMRNSLLTALMPTASSAHILGNQEAFEAFTELIYARTVLSGQFLIVNKHLVRDLEEIGMWNTETVKSIISARGSLKDVTPTNNEVNTERLEFLKLKYATVFEIPQKVIVDLSIDRAENIDQTQSLNCHMARPTKKKLTAYHFYAWKKGAKTGMYYLRQKALTDPINFAIDTVVVSDQPKVKPASSGSRPVCTEDICTSCNV